MAGGSLGFSDFLGEAAAAGAVTGGCLTFSWGCCCCFCCRCCRFLTLSGDESAEVADDELPLDEDELLEDDEEPEDEEEDVDDARVRLLPLAAELLLLLLDEPLLSLFDPELPDEDDEDEADELEDAELSLPLSSPEEAPAFCFFGWLAADLLAFFCPAGLALAFLSGGATSGIVAG